MDHQECEDASNEKLNDVAILVQEEEYFESRINHVREVRPATNVTFLLEID